MKNKKGFTLLELLIVVLIIGILAGIALPQYQLAVDKAQFVKYQSMTSSLKSSYNEYVLLHGKGTRNFHDLSFDIPNDFTDSYSSYVYNCISNNDMFCCMSDFNDSDNYSGRILCGKNDLSIMINQALYSEEGNPLTKMTCRAAPDSVRGNKLCASMGEHYTNTSTVWTPQGIKNNYVGYYM